MDNIDAKNILSVTQLQKLSLKKLRKYRMPLFVMDFKSKRRIFVILDAQTFEGMESAASGIFGNNSPPKDKTISCIDYRAMGLLWDRPGTTNAEFHKMIKDPRCKEHAWAIKRLLEYAPSTIVTHLISLEELQSSLKNIPLRPYYREAWNHAIHYWTKNS